MIHHDLVFEICFAMFYSCQFFGPLFGHNIDFSLRGFVLPFALTPRSRTHGSGPFLHTRSEPSSPCSL